MISILIVFIMAEVIIDIYVTCFVHLFSFELHYIRDVVSELTIYSSQTTKLECLSKMILSNIL
jgi:hypothetical protein